MGDRGRCAQQRGAAHIDPSSKPVVTVVADNPCMADTDAVNSTQRTPPPPPPPPPPAPEKETKAAGPTGTEGVRASQDAVAGAAAVNEQRGAATEVRAATGG